MADNTYVIVALDSVNGVLEHIIGPFSTHEVANAAREKIKSYNESYIYFIHQLIKVDDLKD